MIARAIESVLGQSLQADEVIVVDDGSSDSTPDILESFSSRIKIITQTNQGVSSARNSGIKMAKGEWLAFLDSDDEWLPEKLNKQIRFHKDNPEILVSQPEDIWIRNGKRVNAGTKYAKPEGYVFDKILSMCVISPSGIMMHKNVFEQTGLFDEYMPVCEDYDMWLRIARNFRIGLLHEQLVVKYGGHEDQLSRKYPGMDMFRIMALEKHLDKHKFRQMVIEELVYKCKIVQQGALKRKNAAVYETYKEKLEYYQNI